MTRVDARAGRRKTDAATTRPAAGVPSAASSFADLERAARTGRCLADIPSRAPSMAEEVPGEDNADRILRRALRPLERRTPGVGGKALDPTLRTSMEEAFGEDFSHIRIHEGAEAESIGASAYTLGEDIHFRRGLLDPHSHRGRALLGHELMHVVQRRQGLVPSIPGDERISVLHNRALEAAADAAGQRVATGAAPLAESRSQGGAPTARASAGPILAGGGDAFAAFDPLASDEEKKTALARLNAPPRAPSPPPVPVPAPVLSPEEQRRAGYRAFLAPRFDVADWHELNQNRAPNAVTHAEFANVVQRFGDIFEGKSAIRPKQQRDNEQFRAGLHEDFARILQTPAGRNIVSDLGEGKHNVDIGRSEGQSLDWVTTALHAHQVQSSAMGSSSDPRASTVRYTPGETLKLGGSALPATSDTTLFHELVHAHHLATGTMLPPNQKVGLNHVGNDISHPDLGVNLEEYQTVGLGPYAGGALTENAYRSQQSDLLTRAAAAEQDEKKAEEHKDRAKLYRERRSYL